MVMCYDWLELMCLSLNSPLTPQSIHVCSLVVPGILMLQVPMQIRLNKDQCWRAVMVKGQKRQCGPALTTTVPPVDGHNGFAPMLSASYWKKQHLSANSLCSSSGWFNATGNRIGIQVQIRDVLKKNKVRWEGSVPCGSACASSLFRWSWWRLSVFSPLPFSWAVGQKAKTRGSGLQ